MTTHAYCELEGFEDYVQELLKAGEDIDAIAAEGLEAGAQVLVEGMQRRAPFPSLSDAVSKTQIYHDGNKVYIYVGIFSGEDPDTERIANVWEFGGRATANPSYSTRKPRPGIVAHPYIRPTLRNDAKKARAAMEAVFQDWLKQ